MSYWLGIDLGTTSSAAAVVVDGRAEMVDLSHAAKSTPSIVVRAEGGKLVVGDHAVRVAATRPTGTAREFKRRFGDSTPIVLDGDSFAAHELMAVLFHHVVQAVVAQRGELPAGITVSHPTNWGSYKRDLLHNTLVPVWSSALLLVTEPEAAAIHYAAQDRIPDGMVVAVYDLGGGTFDSAVLRKLTNSADGVPRWEQLGRPGGIEHLGGIDFDEVIVQMMLERLELSPSDLDEDDPVIRAAVSQLRSSCRDAKELLSTTTSATIVSFLPGASRAIRITRAEFERLIRPRIEETADELASTIASAFSNPNSIDRVLLVGGSSRIPLIGQVLADRVGRPLVVDTHPKHAVAMGAATTLGRQAATAPARPSQPPLPPVQLATTRPIRMEAPRPPLSVPVSPPMPPKELRPTPRPVPPAPGRYPIPRPSQPVAQPPEREPQPGSIDLR
ncbi:MAG: molecular chaperone DnaK [Acidimicrobiales bacterium]